jgi:hypothetical protein
MIARTAGVGVMFVDVELGFMASSQNFTAPYSHPQGCRRHCRRSRRHRRNRREGAFRARPRGLEVVLFDRGPWLKPKDYSGDEIKYINRNFLWPDPKLKPRTVRADEKTDFQRASGGDLLDQRLGDVDALAAEQLEKTEPQARPHV